MVWTKKAAAPATFDLASAFTALITGDAIWGWLLSWIPLMPPEQFDTATFCALGPPPAVPALTPLDFMSNSRATPIQWIVGKIGLGYKLQQLAYDRIFSAYCEQAVAATSGCGPNLGSWNVTGDWINLAIPPNTVDIKLGGAAGGHMQEARRSSQLSTNGINWGYALNHGASGGDELVHWSATASGETPPHTEQFVCIRTNGWQPTFIQFCGSDAYTQTYTPTPQPKPTGVLAPPTRTYATTADLGAELDALEFKLELVQGMLGYLSKQTSLGPTTADAPVAASAGPVISPTAVGYRIDVSGIPAGASEMFGTPVKYLKIGRATLGSANGWLPSVEISHTPFLLAPIPPGIDRCQVVVNPPATATITALQPPK